MNCIILESPDGDIITVQNGDIVGRDSIGKETLSPYTKVSRRHVQFLFERGNWAILDLGSRNGTYLDGKLMEPKNKTPLINGSTLLISPEFSAKVKIECSASAPSIGDREGRAQAAVMFMDLTDSVDYFQEMGTVMARQWIVTFYKMLTEIIHHFNGLHVKNIGDEVMAVFDNVNDAARAALKMQNRVKEHNAGAEEAEHYQLKIAINSGSVLFENKDVFGNAVNIASRVQDCTPTDSIYVTEDFIKDLNKHEPDFVVTLVERMQFKGIKNKVAIYKLMKKPPKKSPSSTNH
ncbi:adenylate/guanylate cyclase domain-containing protein [Nitrospirota bacterium]